MRPVLSMADYGAAHRRAAWHRQEAGCECKAAFTAELRRVKLPIDARSPMPVAATPGLPEDPHPMLGGLMSDNAAIIDAPGGGGEWTVLIRLHHDAACPALSHVTAGTDSVCVTASGFVYAVRTRPRDLSPREWKMVDAWRVQTLAGAGCECAALAIFGDWTRQPGEGWHYGQWVSGHAEDCPLASYRPHRTGKAGGVPVALSTVPNAQALAEAAERAAEPAA